MDILERINAYDCSDGGHSDAAQGSAYDLIRDASEEIWCLREVVRGVRIMANAGAFNKYVGEPWLKRVQNIDLGPSSRT